MFIGGDSFSCMYSPSVSLEFHILVDQTRMICVPVDLDHTQGEGLSCVNLDMPVLYYHIVCLRNFHVALSDLTLLILLPRFDPFRCVSVSSIPSPGAVYSCQSNSGYSFVANGTSIFSDVVWLI